MPLIHRGNREPDVPCCPQASTRRLADTSTGGNDPMKRRDFIKVTGIGVAGAATMAAPAIAQSTPEIKWRMPTSWPKSLDTLYGGAETMAQLLAEPPDNTFQVQTFGWRETAPGMPGL